MGKLIELAERAERASEGSVKLDAAIDALIRPEIFDGDAAHYATMPVMNRADLYYLRTCGVRRYTDSVDAAMKLADGLERFGGVPGMLREAMARMSGLPVMLSAMDPDEYRSTLARYLTASSLRARDGGEGL